MNPNNSGFNLRYLDESPCTSKHTHQRQNNILEGLWICLTGLLAKDKDIVHKLIVHHGGSYSRDLYTHKTTHLIAKTRDGQKFKEAVKCNHIDIVSPEWLYLCEATHSRVSTVQFRLVERPHIPVTYTIDSISCKPKCQTQYMESPTCNLDTNSNSRNLIVNKMFQGPVDTICSTLLESGNIRPNPLFSSLYFLLLGFPDGYSASLSENETPVSLKIKEAEGQTESSGKAQRSSIKCHLVQKEKNNLLRLIRIGHGTVLWRWTHNVTHVIVKDGCQHDFINSISSACCYHPNVPVPVSPHWIIASIYHRGLVLAKLYPPTAVRCIKPKSQTKQTSTRNKHVPKQNSYLEVQTSKKSLLFRGSIFHLLSLTQSSINKTVKFNATEIEKTITTHSGVLLSQSVIDILQKDTKRGLKSGIQLSDNPDTNRVCYIVVLTGGFVQSRIMNYHPLIAQVSMMKGLCQIVTVTPIWIQTCVSDKIDTKPDKYPLLFQPQSWFMRKLPNSLNKGKGIKVSITGFIGSERTGMQHMLKIIGADYTDNLRVSNTHLICKETMGAKFKKAIEWGIHVISDDWLYHIAQYGYGGREESSTGCEDFFSQTDIETEHMVHNTIKSSSALLVPQLTSQKTEDVSSKSIQLSDCNSGCIRATLNNLESPLHERIIGHVDSTYQRKRRRRGRNAKILYDEDFVPNPQKENMVIHFSDDDEEKSPFPVDPSTHLMRIYDPQNGTIEESQAIWYGNQF